MKRNFYLLLPALICAALFSSCSKPAGGPAMELAAAFTVGDEEVYFSGGNNGIQNAKAALGRRIFYDKRLSATGRVSCAGCHKPEAAFGDNVQFSVADNGQQLSRNTPSLLAMRAANAGADVPWGWTAGGQTSFAKFLFEDGLHREALGITDPAGIASRFSDAAEYGALLKRAFHKQDVDIRDISNALETYVNALKIFPGQDGGNYVKISVPPVSVENAGNIKAATFVKFGCNYCHAGAPKTAGSFANNGIIGLSVPGEGPAESGAALSYAVPTLVNISVTGPYMHDGRFATLEDALDHCATGIQDNAALHPVLRDANGRPVKMTMTPAERADIIDYLKSLNDRRAMDSPLFSDPFAVAKAR